MRVWGIVIAAGALAVAGGVGGKTAWAQESPAVVGEDRPAAVSELPAGSLVMSAKRCVCWTLDDGTQVVELTGSPRVQLDRAKLTAQRIVAWIRPAPGRLLDEQQVEVALLGGATLQQADVTRTDRNLLVRAVVSGTIRLSGERESRDDSDSLLYHAAAILRSGRELVSATTSPTTAASTKPTTASSTQPTTFPSTRFATSAPTTAPASGEGVGAEPDTKEQWSEAPPATQPTPPPASKFIDFDVQDQQTEHDEQGNICAVLSGGVTLRYGDDKGNLLEFLADRSVLFTNLKSLKGSGQGRDFKHFIADHVQSAYFEGDVRVFSTPADQGKPELRMRAARMYYELATDRAVMTDVVFHTVDLQKQLPVVMRAKTMRQLSTDEWTAQGVQLTTSSFASPDYELGAGSIYVHAQTVDSSAGDTRPGANEAVTFDAQDATFHAFGVPVFYFPNVGGTMTANGFPLRAVSVGSSSNFGFGVHTDWGLFESLGKVAPKDTDASYRLDYFGSRGPGVGVDATYTGGVVDDTTKQPFDFTGDLHAYFVEDHGDDVLGGIRPDVKPPHEFTGRAYLEHQFFFPDDWQAQIRLGYISDDDFLQQWFPDEYWQGKRIDESLYLKHTHDDEVFSLLAQWQPNDVVTTSDDVPAQREVEHLPQLAYYREAAPLLDDNASLFSENTATGLKFAHSSQTLAEQGFIPGFGPGEPAFAYTGDPGDYTYRGDFREELDYPIPAGPVKVVPYVFGRYTVYSQGVQPGVPTKRINLSQKTVVPDIETSSDQNRVMAGAGVRMSTQFWHVDDQTESDLFDIHRIRHVIEPEVDLFTSAQTIDQDHLFIYDPSVDGINDVQAVDVALRQRWQTKRGGPGRWRSVDFFTWNLEGDFYGNQPAARFRDPVDFRGLYFSSEPEFSQARNSINSDELWRLTDTTAVLSDLSHNLDSNKLATASLGFAATRTDLVSYYLGCRYIDDLHSTFGSTEINYNLTRKYNLDLSASIDLQTSKGVFYSTQLTRHFDRYDISLRAYYDQNSNDNGFSVSFQPYGFAKSVGSNQLTQPQ